MKQTIGGYGYRIQRSKIDDSFGSQDWNEQAIDLIFRLDETNFPIDCEYCCIEVDNQYEYLVMIKDSIINKALSGEGDRPNMQPLNDWLSENNITPINKEPCMLYGFFDDDW